MSLEPNNNNIELILGIIRNLPENERSQIADIIHKEEVRHIILAHTKKIEQLEQNDKRQDKDINSLKQGEREQNKRIIYLEEIEAEKKLINEGWKEASTISNYLFPGNNILKTISGQVINIFYFAFGLRGKEGIYAKKYICGNRDIAIKKDSYFYQDEKREGKKMVPFWPGNVRKIRALFDDKLKNTGFFNDFYNAEDSNDILYIAAYLGSERLNKSYNCMINLALPKKELIREFKKNYRLGEYIEELTDINIE